MARSMLSFGMFADLAESTASRRRGFISGSPPPSLAATVSSRMILLQAAARRWSVTAFLRLIDDHLLCPAMTFGVAGAGRIGDEFARKLTTPPGMPATRGGA